MRVPRSGRYAPTLAPVLCLVIALTTQLLVAQPASGVAPAPRVVPGNAAFARTWARTDQPVADLTVARTWMWGPEANTPVLQENYNEAPAGKRDVQYFDKARMEITYPNGDQDSIWYVTNGLLVVELITGRMQLGDNLFTTRAPAQVNVAGDPNDTTGPTYATFANLLQAPPLADGAAISQRLDRFGGIANDASLLKYGVTAAQRVQVPNIDHQVASPFWAFMNSSGPIVEGGQLGEAPLFVNAFYATGYPISEAYWATVEVAGIARDVLMQCFERRCLTYTPGNPAGFETEAGNVGQHYYTWRYALTVQSLRLNEVQFWPADDADEWVEIVNPTSSAVDLNGWTLSSDAGDNTVGLPPWTIPAGAYLSVVFGNGTNDPNFSDGSATFYTGSPGTSYFDRAADGVGLYHSGDTALFASSGTTGRGITAGGDGAERIVDYLAWSFGTSYAGGAAHADAVQAGLWPSGAFVEAFPRRGVKRTHPVQPGESIGRDQNSADTDTPADWDVLGGADAVWSTLGGPNLHTDFRAPNLPTPSTASDTKEWTILAFLDGRDPTLSADLIAEINRMEQAGSTTNINVLVQFAWADDETGELRASRYYIEQDADPATVVSPELPLDPGSDSLNPGDPETLAELINWATGQYPAEHYAIVFGGHGNGWKGLFTSGPIDDFLTMSDLSNGLSSLGDTFEMIKFDAPMMASVEVGFQISEQADTMVASQEVMWGGFPWQTFLGELEANMDWTAGQLADRAAELHANVYRDCQFDGFTLSSVDLDGLASTMPPLVSTLADALRDADIADNRTHDLHSDNGQIVIKHDAQETAEDFTDTNFKDLGDFAARIATLPLAAAEDAAAIFAALEAGGEIVRWEDHGALHPTSHGLSIYFPHDQDIADPTPKSPSPAGARVAPPFDDPLYDPSTSDTHLYKRDANILLPVLAETDHPMADDPGFRFPNDSTWDEFLHRYYKPVADACIRTNQECVSETTVPVGTTVQLSGNGSSDSDGPEGPSNDVPAHTLTSVEHYYWDFATGADHPAGAPAYQDGILYIECDDEDCDRDGTDEPDDDPDATGTLVEFTCASPGEYAIRLVVWDEHHDLPRISHEDRGHNDGRHWQHFNLDDDWVTLHCQDVLRKESIPPQAAPADPITYRIVLPAPAGAAQTVAATITDPLPDAVQLADDSISCSTGACLYNADANAVEWSGSLNPDTSVTLEFVVTLVPETLPPLEITNCAGYFDGITNGQVCSTTAILSQAGTGSPALRYIE